MKILSIKKRNPVACAFTVEYYKVTVETDDGDVETLNCWGGGYSSPAEAENILFDIDRKLGTKVFCEHFNGKRVEGYEKVELVVEGKVVHKVNNENIILHVNTQQNSDAIAQNLRNQAQSAKSTGIRYGK